MIKRILLFSTVLSLLVSTITFAQEREGFIDFKTYLPAISNIYSLEANLAYRSARLGIGGFNTLNSHNESDYEEIVLSKSSRLITEYRHSIALAYANTFSDLIVSRSSDMLDVFTRDSDTCIFLGAFLYDKILNTLRVDEQERSRTLVREFLLPIAYRMYPHIKETPFTEIMLIGICGSRDFSKDDAPEATTVTCLIKVSDISKVIDEFEDTEEDLLKNIDVFIHGDGATVRKSALW